MWSSHAEMLEARAIRPQEIMARINKDTFKSIGSHWHNFEDGMEMPEFVLLISQFARHAPHERIDLLNGACKLFTEIDINGDGKLEWNEFVLYVSDQVATAENRRPLEGPGVTDPLWLVENRRKRELTSFQQFHFREAITDKTKHRKPILQVIYNKGAKYSSLQAPCILYCEQISSYLCWMNALTLQMIYADYVPFEKQGTFVRSIAFENFDAGSEPAQQTNASSIYAVSCTDYRIYLYKQKANVVRFYKSFDTGKVMVSRLFHLTMHK